MNIEALYHRAQSSWASANADKSVRIRIRTMLNDAQTIELIYGDKYDWTSTLQQTTMHKWISDERFDYWEAVVTPPFGRLSYRFHVIAEETHVWYAERWCKDAPYEDAFGNFELPYVNIADVFTPPAWVKDAVFYQIFPDRFANGDPSINPADVQPWGGTPTFDNHFGGDLQGVIDKLDYLTELGINAIYFNPLFQAASYHKYDTIDYFAVDRHFGDIGTLKRLVAECHKRGIRVMLDAVFNHAGRYFPPFVDVLDNGAASPYADWFLIHEWPICDTRGSTTYETFGFEPHMPKFNTANPKVRHYLLDIARFWIEECDIDGYRLDVANEVDHGFWRKFRELVKSLKPDAYILGEIMHDSMPWLQGDQLDGVMNYPITDFILKFMVKDVFDAREFADAVGGWMALYPHQVNETAFNLLSSHDIPRLLSSCQGNIDRMKLAVMFQFTYPGAPCIYYGDEIGLTGEGDPDNRKCMEWDIDRQDRDLFYHFAQTIALRKRHEALRNGMFRFLYAPSDSRLIVYERKNEHEHFIIAMNASPEPQTLDLPLPEGHWQDQWNSHTRLSVVDGGSKPMVRLQPYGFHIFKQTEE
ncbi:alpha amylase catalytic region [Paenibacillus curdlanolyticus YK9]|uniref:Alpha amylase catalytic region n=1 Tax=Paenibacillus curdlanolyticus YK9 TaxID=717606 RepID=E0IC05_9BACL|nr:alpha-glycosidase [Paenibacillus curdlanolyticus]EFM10235.1 alpha amylase catalytic region [Paenibacillus curdlanolyticus YK9]